MREALSNRLYTLFGWVWFQWHSSFFLFLIAPQKGEGLIQKGVKSKKRVRERQLSKCVGALYIAQSGGLQVCGLWLQPHSSGGIAFTPLQEHRLMQAWPKLLHWWRISTCELALLEASLYSLISLKIKYDIIKSQNQFYIPRQTRLPYFFSMCHMLWIKLFHLYFLCLIPWLCIYVRIVMEGKALVTDVFEPQLLLLLQSLPDYSTNSSGSSNRPFSTIYAVTLQVGPR